MAEALDPKSESNSRKRGENIVSNTLSNKNLTPVTIMVVDTIGAVKSRQLLKILLDSGSTTMLTSDLYLRNVSHAKYLRVDW
jgi:hypothetical protein